MLNWGLPTEPYLFIVGCGRPHHGVLEGILGEDEVRAALIDVSGDSWIGARAMRVAAPGTCH